MRNFKNIVVTTDLSENGQGALPFAIAMAKQHAANLHLVFVEEPDSIYPTDNSLKLPQVQWMIAERKKRAQEFRDQAEEIARRESLVVTTHLMEGDPKKEILEITRANHGDCIVMSTSGRRGIPRILFGSVTEEVLRNSSCPVLCVKPKEQADVFTSGPILVTTDLSNDSLEALPIAIALAKHQNVKLHLLKVLEDKISDEMRPPEAERFQEEHRVIEQKVQMFAAQLSRGHGIEIAPHLLYGKPALAILSFAGEIKAGCIVIASHGRSGFRRMLVGSVAEEVIRNSLCPVLAVRNGIAQSTEVQMESEVKLATTD